VVFGASLKDALVVGSKASFLISGKVLIGQDNCAAAKVKKAQWKQEYVDGTLEISVHLLGDLRTFGQEIACVSDGTPVYRSMRLDVVVDPQQATKVMLKNADADKKNFDIMVPAVVTKVVTKEIVKSRPNTTVTVKAEVAPFKNECEQKAVVLTAFSSFTSQKPSEVKLKRNLYAVHLRAPDQAAKTCNAAAPASKVPTAFTRVVFPVESQQSIVLIHDLSNLAGTKTVILP